MEKKKLLLVAISVGIFLIIVIGFSILIFSPKKNAQATASRPIRAGASGIEGESTPARTQPATVDAVDMIRNREGVQGLQSPPATVSAGENNERAGETPSQPGTGENATNLVVAVPKPSVTVSSTAPKPASVPASQPKPAVTPKPAAQPAARVEPKSTVTPAAKPQATPVAVSRSQQAPVAARPAVRQQDNVYWVQVGAYSTQVRAEGVKETLSAKGVTPIIENSDVNGQRVYRVRVGPYSQDDVNYWLNLIRAINGFEDSQVRISQR
ncbi:MAG: SPOR domain-containing protein [Treponema sp.]|jgi:DedD protein|nr:SPOR domain-containing protein [Treponema sp.]